MMIKLRFPGVWVDRVMSFVSITSFSVWINGKVYENITLSRSIHQGDPLSPYLFLICAKGFTLLLTKAEFEGRLHGLSVYRSALSITNLLLLMILWFFVKLIKMKCRLFMILYSYKFLGYINLSSLINLLNILIIIYTLFVNFN